MNWLDTFKHLLPNAKAWRITADKQLREFFQGLTIIGSDPRAFFDGIYRDIDPQETRELEQWEQQFALPRSNLTEQERRDRLAATWQALGGQDPRYIEDTLQAAGFDVYVHEWWEPTGGTPAGGSVNGDVVPVARDPFDYLDDGSDAVESFLMVDGAESAQDGDSVAQDGSTSTPPGYPLVNKIVVVASIITRGDGSESMQDGGAVAQDGESMDIYGRKQYTMPEDPTKYPYFLYIGGATFPDLATVTQARRDEFEDLCLKICPTEQWLGILVNYA